MSRTLRAFSRARETLDQIELEYSSSNVRNCVTFSGVACPYFFSKNYWSPVVSTSDAQSRSPCAELSSMRFRLTSMNRATFSARST